MVTVHVAPETASHPLQPVKNALGLAVSVTSVSLSNSAAQSVPQLIPAGLELTMPDIPVLLTLSAKRFRSKPAVTVLAPVIVTVHVVPDTLSHPVQPRKTELPAGLAVSVTLVPFG
jgi:hypothetical protein